MSWLCIYVSKEYIIFAMLFTCPEFKNAVWNTTWQKTLGIDMQYRPLQLELLHYLVWHVHSCQGNQYPSTNSIIMAIKGF